MMIEILCQRGGAGKGVESTHLFFKFVKTTDKVKISGKKLFCMVKYSQISSFTWVAKGLVLDVRIIFETLG